MKIKLEDINPIKKDLEERFFGRDGLIRVVFREDNCFKQYKFVGDGVYIFEKYVEVDGNQLRLNY